MTTLYSALTSNPPLAVAESTRPYSLFTERHLQAVWFEQKYFKNLQTIDQKEIIVISPGIWNLGAGPDFQRAHLVIDGVEMFGDVELHLTPEDWYHHGHQNDSRYSNVVLHLSLWPFKQQSTLCNPAGKPIFQAYLSPYLTVPETRITQLIDLDLYPYTKFVGSGRCSHQLFRDLSEEKAAHLFKTAATWRLEKKRTYLQAHVKDSLDSIGVGLALALGYKQNSQTFLQLYHWLSPLKALSEEALLSLVIGACGLFENKYRTLWEKSEFYQHLSALYMMTSFSIPLQPKFTLTLNQIRPYNHPVRRLATLVKIVRDPLIAKLEQSFLLLWKYEWKNRSWSTLKKLFIETLPDYEDAYWNLHYSFEQLPQPKKLSLIGTGTKQEFIINTVLPILYGKIESEGSCEENKAFLSFFESFSALKAGKSKYLIHRFFGDTQKGNLLNNALHEQGAFQIHKDFCLHYEASCEGCPFVERVQPHV